MISVLFLSFDFDLARFTNNVYTASTMSLQTQRCTPVLLHLVSCTCRLTATKFKLFSLQRKKIRVVSLKKNKIVCWICFSNSPEQVGV